MTVTAPRPSKLGLPDLTGRYSLAGALFTDSLGDGLFVAGADLPRRRFVRHHISNVTITVTSPTEAEGASYWMVIGEGGPESSGRYRDTYRRGPEDGWRFATRIVRADPWGTHSD